MKIEYQDQTAFGPQDVAEYLLKGGSEGQDILSNGIFANGVSLSNMVNYNETQDIAVNFIHEGAGYRNTVGYYFFDPETGEISTEVEDAGFIWLDASQTWNGQLTGPPYVVLPQTQQFIIEDVPQNTGLGFFVIKDGYGANHTLYPLPREIQSINELNQYISLEIGEGGVVRAAYEYTDPSTNLSREFVFSGTTYFSHDKTLNHDYTPSAPFEHTLSGVTFDAYVAGSVINDSSLFQGLPIIGFEDLPNYNSGGNDLDYNDLVFSVDLGSSTESLIVDDAKQIVRSIEDVDSRTLSSVSIHTQSLLAGDQLLLVSTPDVIFDTSLQPAPIDSATSGLARVKLIEEGERVEYLLNYELLPSYDNDISLTFSNLEGQEVPVDVFNMAAQQIYFLPDFDSANSGYVRTFTVDALDDSQLIATASSTSTTTFIEQEFKVDLSIDSVIKIDEYTFSFDAAVDHTVEEEFISVFITSSHLGLSLSQGVELNESKWNLTVAELNNVVVVSDSPINEDVELTFEVSYQKDPDLSLTTVDIVHFPTSLNTQVVSQQSVSDTFYYKAGMENAVYNGKEGDSKLILKDVGEINSENGWHLVTTSDASYSIDSANQHINFGESTSGFIEFDNGNEILFTDIEKVSWTS